MSVSDAALQNARALELYMRSTPATVLFRDCFSRDGESPTSQVVLYNYLLSPSEADIARAEKCEAHLQRLFTHIEKTLGKRIDSALSDKTEEGAPADDALELSAVIALDDPRLKDAILDLSAQVINESRRAEGKAEITVGMLEKLTLPEMREVTGLFGEKQLSL